MSARLSRSARLFYGASARLDSTVEKCFPPFAARRPIFSTSKYAAESASLNGNGRSAKVSALVVTINTAPREKRRPFFSPRLRNNRPYDDAKYSASAEIFSSRMCTRVRTADLIKLSSEKVSEAHVNYIPRATEILSLREAGGRREDSFCERSATKRQRESIERRDRYVAARVSYTPRDAPTSVFLK